MYLVRVNGQGREVVNLWRHTTLGLLFRPFLNSCTEHVHVSPSSPSSISLTSTHTMLAFIPALIAGLTLVSAQRTSTNITISTLPTFSTCQPAIINWSGGSGMSTPYLSCRLVPVISVSWCSAPYRVYIYPADWTNSTDWLYITWLFLRVRADARIALPITNRTSITWNVNLAAGFGIVVNVYDGVKDEYSEPSYIRSSPYPKVNKLMD